VTALQSLLDQSLLQKQAAQSAGNSPKPKHTTAKPWRLRWKTTARAIKSAAW
jgi:hypothetical protein